MHNSVRYCKTCSKKFISYPKFIEHLLSKHTSGQMYTCIKCDKNFPQFRKFQYHMKFKHSEKTTWHAQICYVCGTKYSDYRSLEYHIKTHDPDLSKCDHCQMTFTQKDSLRSHIAIHYHDGPAHKCALCQKSFRTAKYLKNHTNQVHTKERPFICDKCGFGAISKYELKTHMNIHSKTKQYQCKARGIRFRWPGNLNTHLRRVCANI